MMRPSTSCLKVRSPRASNPRSVYTRSSACHSTSDGVAVTTGPAIGRPPGRSSPNGSWAWPACIRSCATCNSNAISTSSRAEPT